MQNSNVPSDGPADPGSDAHTRPSELNADKLSRLYDTILSNTPDLAYVFALDHTFIYVNRALLEMWGTAEEDAIGKSFLELGYVPWHAEMHDREIDQVIATKEPIRGTVPFAGKQGRRIYDYIFVPVFDADGNVEAVAGTTRDVTEMKGEESRNSLLIAVSEYIRTISDPSKLLTLIAEALATFFEISRCAFSEVDRKNELLRITASTDNPGASKVYNLSEFSLITAREMEEGRVIAVHDAETDPRTKEVFESFYATKKLISYVAVPFMRAGRWVACLSVTHDAPRGWTSAEIALIETVAERAWNAVEKLRSEAALRESEERFSKAFNASPLSFTITELESGRLIDVNDTFCRVTGFSRSEALGHKPVELGLWNDPAQHQRELANLLNTGSIREAEYTFRVKDGRELAGLISAELLEIGGRQCVLTVIQDITAKKDAERASLEAANRFKSLFDSIDQGFCIIELIEDDDGKPVDYLFVTVSPSFEKESGMVDVVGKTISEIIPYSTSQWIDLFYGVAKTGTPKRLVHYVEATGRWFDIYGFRIGDANSHQVGILFSDITERKQTETALKESEERFRRVANAAPVMIWVADQQMNFTWFNQSWLDFTGQDERPRIHVEDDPKYQKTFEDAFHGRKPFEIEYRLRKADDTYAWVLDRGTPLFGTDNKFRGFIGSCIDIDERRKANESRQRQAALIDLAYDPIFVWDLEGAIVEWNSGAERLYGYKREEVIGKASHELLRTKRPIGVEAFLDELVENGMWSGEVVHFGEDGRAIVVESRQQLISSGGRRLVLESNRDITERKVSEGILERYRLMSEHSIDVIWFISPDGAFVEVNAAAVQAYGYSHDEFLQMNISDVRHPSAMGDLPGQLEIANEHGIHFETLHIKKDGTPLPVEVRANGAEIGGSRLVMAIVRDISERKQNEEALRRSEDRRQLAQKAGNVGIWDWDIVAGVTYWSETMWSFYGETDKSVNPDDQFWSAHLHPSDRDRVKASLSNVVASPDREHFQDEFRIVRADGSIRWIEAKASALRDETGKALRMYGVNLDITERKEAEERVRLSEYQLRVVTNAIPALISYTDSSERFRFVNQKFVEWFGNRPEELVGKRVRDVVGVRAYRQLKPHIDEALAGNETTFETVLDNKKVGKRYVNISYVPDIGVDGTVFGYYGLTHDLTELKRSEDLLRSSEETMGLIAESFTDYAILSMNKNGIISSWNKGAEVIFGFSAEEVIGKPGDIIFTEEDKTRGYPTKEMKHARQLGRASDERWHVRKDGSKFFASGVLMPLYVAGELTGYAKIASDLTEKKRRAEELQRAHDELEVRVRERTNELAESNRALRLEMEERQIAENHRVDLLRRLVSSQEFERRRIARDLHDQLGQRLTALRLKIASLKEASAQNAEYSARVQRLQEIAERLDSEVSFLAWELRPSALDDLGLVEAVGAFVAEWSRHHEIEADFFSSNIPIDHLDKEVETHIYRIAQEALNNITKHAKATRVTVILEKRGENLLLIIEDNGEGFDVTKLKAPKESGRGLGLIGMRERAILVGGNVEIESAPGQGTTIYVKVPFSS